MSRVCRDTSARSTRRSEPVPLLEQPIDLDAALQFFRGASVRPNGQAKSLGAHRGRADMIRMMMRQHDRLEAWFAMQEFKEAILLGDILGTRINEVAARI